MTTKKDFIQLRIDTLTKNQFKELCIRHNQSMSKVLLEHINGGIALNGLKPYDNGINQSSHIDSITNLDYAPTLLHLLKEFMKNRYEEHACLTDECLMELFTGLLANNELHLLFELEHLDNRIRAEWS